MPFVLLPRRLVLLLTACLLCTHAVAGILNLSPAADAYIQGGSVTDTNYGASTIIQVRGTTGRAYQRLAWLRFDLAPSMPSITAATLELRLFSIANGRPASSIDVFGLPAGMVWDEATLTNTNAPWPASSAHIAPPEAVLLGSIAVPATGGASTGTAFTLSSPALVAFLEAARQAGESSVTFALREPGNLANFISFVGKESVLYAPSRLVLEIDGPGDATSVIPPVQVVPLALTASADTRIQGGSVTDTNYGTSIELQVRGAISRAYQRLAWLRFDLNHPDHPVATPVLACTLQLRLSSIFSGRPASTVDVFGLPADMVWDEATLTNTNAPWPASTAHIAPPEAVLLGSIAVPATGGAPAGAVFTLSSPALAAFLEAARQAGESSVTLVLREPGSLPGHIAFASREHSLEPPTLLLDLAHMPVTRLSEDGSFIKYAALQDAIDAAGPGDIITLEDGVYHQPIVFNASGEPGRPITLAPAENARVVIDAADAGFQTNPAGRWQHDGVSGFWSAEIPLGMPQPGQIHTATSWISRYGIPSPETGGADRLVASYASLDALGAAVRGEGAFRDRETLHVKLAGGQDPNTVPLSIPRAYAVIDLNGHSHIRVCGLELRNASWAGVVVGGAQPSEDIELTDLVIRNCFRGISTRGGAPQGVRIQSARIENGIPATWGWDGSYVVGVGQHPENNSDSFAPWRGFGILLSGATDSEISGCLISGQWDGIKLTGCHGVSVHHNTIRHILDDMVELESKNQSDISFFNNHGYDLFAGISVTTNTPGPIYVYRNVVEVTRPSKLSGGTPKASYGIKSGNDFGGGAYNIKFYHNTFYSQNLSVWEKTGDDYPDRWHGYDFVNNVFYAFSTRNISFRGAGPTDTGGDNHWESNLYNKDAPADELAALTFGNLADWFTDPWPLTPRDPGPRNLRLIDGAPGRGDASSHPALVGWPDSVSVYPGGRDRGAWQAGMASDAIGAPADFIASP